MTEPTRPLGTDLSERYHVERELGEGGMATVYLADDVRHARKVAIKVIRPDAAAALGTARFLSEIRLTASLQHPHILGLIDSGVVTTADGERPFYVMPYVSGETLRARLARERTLPVNDAVAILAEIADALACAHSQGSSIGTSSPRISCSGRDTHSSPTSESPKQSTGRWPDGA